MTRSRTYRLGLTVCDVLVVAGIALVPIVAWKGIRLVEWGLLPLLAAPLVWRRVAPDRTDLWTVALFAQYSLFVAFNAFAYPLLPGTSGDLEAKLSLYVGSALLMLLMILRFRMTLDVGRIWRVVGPIAVIGSVAMLGWEHLTTPSPENCRVGFLAKFVLFPPVWLTIFGIAAYHDWTRLAPWERILRHFALALVVLATVAFSGARAMLIAQAITIPILALLLGRGEALRRRATIMAVLGLFSVAGFAGGIALDLRSDCQFAQRLLAIAQTATRLGDAEELAEESFAGRLGLESAPARREPPAAATPKPDHDEPEPDLDEEEALVGAVFIRAILWKDALDDIRAAPLLGYGILNEDKLVVGNFPHFHQQYLSWLIWGGPLMLASGLAMLFAPLVTFGVRASRNGAVLALAMVGPLAISFLSGSFLLHTVMVMGYVMSLSLLYALARESRSPDWRRASTAGGGATGLYRYMARD